MKERKAWLDYLTYLAVRLVAAGLAMFPIDTVLRAMRRLGWVWYYLPHALPETRIPGWAGRLGFMRWSVKLTAGSNKLLGRFREHRLRAEGHIRRALPDFDEERVSAVALASMQQLAMLAVELLLSPRLVTRWTWARYVKLRKLDEAIRVLLQGRGCIMLTGHYGNWELLGFALATLGFDIVAVMRPLDNEYLNRHLLERRERSGLRLLYKRGVAQSAGDVLTSGGVLCFIADQNAGHKGLFVDFFGRPASTYKSIGLLAMEYEVPIVVGCARRIGERFEYEICVNRVIYPQEWKDQKDELKWITQEYSAAIEEFVRVAPEQYLWIHRRWKSRPKAERAKQKSEDRPPEAGPGDPARIG
jgi:KDO2-lipid IV(A) lauroyltransferase